MLVALSGGSGGAKLVEGLARESDPGKLTVVCNTADDVVVHGLHVSPDLDTVMYTLAGLRDDAKGWGIRGDTFHALEQLGRYGRETWFRLGDRDLATHIVRTELLSRGYKLSQVTAELCGRLGVAAVVLPMADERVVTRVKTRDGDVLAFQEYFVRRRWQPEVAAIAYEGLDRCRPAPGLLRAIGEATVIVVCPSNPVTSIGPILGVPGIRDALRETRARVVGVSPLVGTRAITGPAHRLMAAAGMEPSAYGVAAAYADFLDCFVIDRADRGEEPRLRSLGIETAATDILMDSVAAKSRLAREVLALAKE
ncbi:MAG TPA: 2-phospho-L-lactate transferase [candidate division Zixibacteria bacterium]|nr:2-phospho-L-lactate transferase [candidate division Zixibacteria bacterium]